LKEIATKDYVSIIPQTVFSCRGSYGVGKGPLNGPAPRCCCGWAFSLVIYSESETDLQKHFVKWPFWGAFCIWCGSGDDLWERCLLKLPGLLDVSLDIHGYPRNPWIPVSFENTRTISSQNTRNQILMKWIYYTRKTKIRGHPKNWDFTGKYNRKMSFLTKPWNDPILRAVILHCVIFVQVRQKYKFKNRFFC